MELTNPWVGYFTRSYEQLKDSILSALGSLVPEMTDHTESNIAVRMLNAWCGIAEMLGYHIDAMAREAYIETCRLNSSAMSIANQLDYRVHAWVAASVELTFTTDAPVAADYTIPAGTIADTQNGERFITTADTTILSGQSTANVPARQHLGVLSIVSFVATGTEFQEYELPVNIADSLVTVKVNGITWTGQETLAYSLAASQHYVQTVNRNNVPVVRFGDGVMGRIPPAGQPVQVYYYPTLGEAGNVGQGTIISLVTVLPIPSPATLIDVTNNVRASGGSNNESLESLRRRIPMSLRVMDRAVTRQDYIDNAELVNGVAKGGVVYECGKTVDIYVVPDGGGIASDILCNDVLVFMDSRRMITTRVRVFPAGEVRTTINLAVHVLPGHDPAFVNNAVKAALALFLSYQNQDIQGALFLSDLYEVVEAVDGVGNSLIASVLFQPYAHKVPPTTLTLDWTPVPQAGVTETAEWKFVALIGGTQFHVFRNDAFEITADVGTTYNLPEITFTINAAAYTVGDTYVFHTYPGNLMQVGAVQLEEPSIFVSLVGDINITNY